MSDNISVSKKLPLSVSLGLHELFSLQETNSQDMLDKFNSHEKKEFLFFQDNFVLMCGNHIKRPRVSQLNEIQMALVVRRALALKNTTTKKVLIVVNNRYEGALVAEQFNKYASCFKVYSRNEKTRTKLNEDIYTKYLNEADFEILTYNSLWIMVTKKKKSKPEQRQVINPSLITDQIIFVNPIRKRFLESDLARLDVITICILRFKRKKPDYSFFFDEAWFPLLTKRDYQYLTGARTTLYYRCSEPVRSTINDIYSTQGVLPFISKSQYKLFVFSMLSRGRKTLKKLLISFQETFTYKIHLFSERLFSNELNNLTRELPIRKNEIDNRIFAGIVEELNYYTKKHTKCLHGETDFNINTENGEISSSNNIIWKETEVEPTKVLPVIYKGRDDNKYYLSSLGEDILAETSCYDNITMKFSLVLRKVEAMLFQEDKQTVNLTVKEIIRFYLSLLNVNQELADRCLAQIPEKVDTEKKVTKLVKFLKTELKQLLEKYGGYSVTKILGSFKQLMDTESYLVYKQLKKKDDEEEQSWEEKRIATILLLANRKLLTVKFTGRKFHMLFQPAANLLKSLVAEGRLVQIHTYNHRGKLTYKYCTQELLDANPHLKKNCGNCLWYRKRFKTCTYLRLQQAFNPSNLKAELRTYANGKIRPTATACGEHKPRADYELEGGGTQFTRTIEELSKEMREISMSYVTRTVTENVYKCFTCQKPIEEFGTGTKLLFPRKRKRVSCPNCLTLYIKKKNGKVTVRAEYKHLLRGLYYKENTSLPKVLLEKDPCYSFIIFDSEHLTLDLSDADDTSPDLLICNRRIPLKKLQYLYFAGKRYKELERFLIVLAASDPERYSYTIQRAEEKEEEELGKEDENESRSTIELENTSLQPFNAKQYTCLKSLMNYSYEKGLFKQEFLHARALSNLGAMLAIKDAYEMMGYGHWKYEYQLSSMVDILIRVNGGVKTSYYGSQLEGLSNNYFFELLKDEATLVNLWSWGRVNSRFVNDLFVAYSKSSNAYSPFDALLNQLMRYFRAEIDEIFRKVGLEPAKLGPGLFHRRKSKSDIDQLGFYFDLIEPVRALVLLTMSKAVREKILTSNDCSFKLGERGQEIYQVKSTSLPKIGELVSEALNEVVFYRGATIPFAQAFEKHLRKLREAFELCFERLNRKKKKTKQEIEQTFKEAKFSPMVFCPAGMERILIGIHKFANKQHELFRGREKEVLENKRSREKFQKIAMKNLMLKDPSFKSKIFRVTKHQQKEQDRSLFVLSLMLSYAYHKEFTFEWHSNGFLQDLLGLTQNQMIRIMKQMVTRGFLLEKKVNRTKFYRVNLDNTSVKRLHLTLGLGLSKEEILERKSVWKAILLLQRISKVFSNLLLCSENQAINYLWNNWTPSETLQRLALWLSDHLAENKRYFELVGLEGKACGKE